MKAYEALFILSAILKKEEMDALIQEMESEISKNQGEVVESQRIGRRRLEYSIRKHVEGYFVQVNFRADSQAIKKLTAKYRLKEGILRFFFVDRKDGFVKFKSFDENAYVPEGGSYGYPQDASSRQGA